MTYEEALYWHTHNSATIEQEREAESLIKEALQKQIAKKVERHSDGTHFCNVCGNTVKSYQNYCYECGQKLSWIGVTKNDR